MASASCSGDVLKATDGKTRFIRLARLLLCGGTTIMRELFDFIIPPANLATVLSSRTVLVRLKNMKKEKFLTHPQWDNLFPPTGTCVQSSSFDITLLFKLLREKVICDLIPPSTGWDQLPNIDDISLPADLARIKYYRNTIAHVDEKMELTEHCFIDYWKEVKDALVRIVRHYSESGSSTVTVWETAIEKLLTDPLIENDEKNVEKLKSWYLDEIGELKQMVEQLLKKGEGEGRVFNVRIVSKIAAVGGWLGGNIYILNRLKDHPELLLDYAKYGVIPSGIALVCIAFGSIKLTLKAETMDGLEEIWKRYKTGKLKENFEKVMITDELKTLANGKRIELSVEINEEEVVETRRHLTHKEMEKQSEKDAEIRQLKEFRKQSEEDAEGIGCWKMSGEAAPKQDPLSPVKKYGKDSDFGQILDFIQGVVSNEALREQFDIPHLVVVGRQNMAKTTLINRLIGRYLLPMRKGKTATQLQALTTYPILLNLRTDEIYRIEISVAGEKDIGGVVENPQDETVEQFLREVAGRLAKEPGTEISKTPVNVTLYGPGLSPLTLVDLPGVHFANDNDRMNVVTQSLVLDYIKKNKKSIIVIVSQVGDPTGDGAINLVMKHAEDYKARTICVLTKPDKHNESDDIGRKVATNQSHFTLEDNHFILLRGKDGTDPVESLWDAETTRCREKEWFARHKQYSDLMEICGIDRLMDTMIKLLSDKMIVEIPLLIKKMEVKKSELEQELRVLSESAVPATSEGKGDLMARIQYQLIDKLKILLFNNITDSSGGEKVRARIEKFNNQILLVNPLFERTDKEITKLLRKLEGVAAPLGDSSENNQLLERLLYECFHKETNTMFGQPTVLPSPIDTLTSICEKLVKDVETELKTIVLTAVRQCFEVFPDLKKYVEVSLVNAIFDKKQAETMTFIKQFIQMQKKSVDVLSVSIPLPKEIEDAIVTIVANYKEIGRTVQLLPQQRVPEPQLFNQIRHLSHRLHSQELIDSVEACSLKGASYKDKQQIVNTKKNVVRCFNTIKLNIIDTVPRCIQHFFISQLVESLKEALKSADLMEFLREKEDVRRRREQCENTLAGINNALPQTEKIPEMLLRIKQGRRAVK